MKAKLIFIWGQNQNTKSKKLSFSTFTNIQFTIWEQFLLYKTCKSGEWSCKMTIFLGLVFGVFEKKIFFCFFPMKNGLAFIWDIVYFCTRDGFFWILKNTSFQLKCTQLYMLAYKLYWPDEISLSSYLSALGF